MEIILDTSDKLYYSTTNDFSSAQEFLEIIPAASPTVRADITGLSNELSYYVWVQVWNSQCTDGNRSYPHSANMAQSVRPQPKPPINWNDLNFELGSATAEYIYAQDLAPSVFFPEGRPNTDRITRVQEAALGNLFCDGAAWYARKHHPAENIDFVFLNGGYIDQPLYKGTVTVGAIESMVPASSRSDFYTIITLKGTEVKALFEHAAAIRNPGRGSSNTGGWGMVSSEVNYTIVYPQPSGDLTGDVIDAYYGTLKPDTLKIKGQPVSDTAEYRVCTANYIAQGGDGYTSFITAITSYPAIANVRNFTTTPIWQGVCEYIYDKGVITPYLDGRVKQEGGGVMCE